MRLRPLSQEDLPLLLPLAQEAVGEWGATTSPSLNPETLLGNGLWFAADTAGGVVGFAGFQNISWPDRSCELAIGLLQEWRGKRLAKTMCQDQLTYAAKSLNMRRVVLRTLRNNIPMVKTVEGLPAFKLEGIHKGQRYKHGEYVDVLTFAWVKEG